MSDTDNTVSDTWAAIGTTRFAKEAHRTRKAFKSRVTNGKSFLPGIDGRSVWSRRARDVHRQLVQDRGGVSVVSTAETLIARRAAVLEAELERYEVGFAEAGEAEASALCLYQTVANCQRRLLEAIGLERRARDVTQTIEQFVDDIEAAKATEKAAGKPNAPEPATDVEAP